MSTKSTAEKSDLREEIRKALRSQKQPTVTVLSSLIAVQDHIRYLPDEAIEETASFTGATINDVWSVASFYTNFRFTPPGRHIIDVCWGPTCHLLGAQKILRAIQTEIGVEEEGETEDGNLTLRYSTCLGACAAGPVIGIDHHLIGRCDVQSAVSAVADAKTDV